MPLRLIVATALLFGCARHIEILSRTTISGAVNASEVHGTVTATIITDRGGRSTCEFARLPAGFNPGTFGTHA